MIFAHFLSFKVKERKYTTFKSSTGRYSSPEKQQQGMKRTPQERAGRTLGPHPKRPMGPRGVPNT